MIYYLYHTIIKNLDNYFKYEIELGIAYEHDTNPNDIIDLKDEVKFVQCMGIEHVGVQGAHFDQTIFDRINFVKENLPDPSFHKIVFLVLP